MQRGPIRVGDALHRTRRSRTPSRNARLKSNRRHTRRTALADVAYIVLTTTTWLVGNLLGILGCAVAAFVVISHGHIDTFFLHVDNLAARYVAADLGRRAVFAHQLVQLFVIVFAATMLLRGPAFVARLRRDLAEKVA